MNSADANTLQIVAIEQTDYQSVLKNKARPVSFPLSVEDKALIQSMETKLQHLGGVGLAAPQINVAKQIIAIYIPEEAGLLRDNVTSYPMHVLINPSYTPKANAKTVYDFESCYSVNSKSGKVPRYNEIDYHYYDVEGVYHSSSADGFYARVLQHEIDHINGILIIDRLTPDCIQGTPQEMMVLRRAELPDEKKVLFDQVMEKKLKK
ncbi:peptide deformylase [Legionella waltersii]|uniref:Peptide deformylase n=1 Tax=Legionella waltersii TaxID=66969 RepID=A0A0W1A736_9GAMM|nr:peptide deformylase [Legionella waltersii]KTD77173.1 polypeptide deformylase [Legionella waltersii]SNV11346.1 polypeptide deformylase [Legionella waltersii]